MVKRRKNRKEHVPRYLARRHFTMEALFAAHPEMPELKDQILAILDHPRKTYKDAQAFLQEKGLPIVPANKMSVWYHARITSLKKAVIEKVQETTATMDAVEAEMKKTYGPGFKFGDVIRAMLRSALVSSATPLNQVPPDKLAREDAKREKLDLERRRLDLEEARLAQKQEGDADASGAAGSVVIYVPEDKRIR